MNEVPGCYFLVGGGVDKPYVHHPAYQFEDEIIPIAAELLLMTALRYTDANLKLNKEFL
ncbi:MAG: hypothetical protein HKM04_06525 [Legionellales bacterium]|nr:hypothetical protein [Legionellales bacterium]